MEFRKIFDTIPEEFDKWRPCYCTEVFEDVIRHSQLSTRKSALEIGPGTGQATKPILQTGCDYTAIELGEHLTEFMKTKFGSYSNFHIINADFETYDFGGRKFDLIYSAAAIQWIPERLAFTRAFDLLKNGGTLAMITISCDYKTPNEDLFNKIQEVYKKYFCPEIPYTQKFNYDNAVNYGFTGFEHRTYHSKREFDADDYVSYIATHCDHIVIKEQYKTQFYEGVRAVIIKAGNRLVLNDTIDLYLLSKQ